MEQVTAAEAVVLLDTHTLIWTLTNRTRLSRRAAHFLDSAGKVMVSAATAWEIATKVRIGKLPEAVALESDFMALTQRAGFHLLAIDAEQAIQAGRFSVSHKDPFDRMLAAQSLALDIPVISIDPKLDAFGIRRIW